MCTTDSSDPTYVLGRSRSETERLSGKGNYWSRTHCACLKQQVLQQA